MHHESGIDSGNADRFNIWKSNCLIHCIHRKKEEKDEGKAFDKIEHPFMTSDKKKHLGIKGSLPWADKECWQNTDNIIFNGERLNNFHPKFGNKSKISILTTMSTSYRS